MPKRLPTAEDSRQAYLSDPFFLSLAASASDCIRVLDRRGEVRFTNAAARRLFEIEGSKGDQGRYWPDLWPDLFRRAAHDAVQAALAGQSTSFRAHGPTAKGAPRCWDNVVSPVWDPQTGALIGVLATSRDVTHELDTHAFLHTVIENVPTVIFVKDAVDGRFLLLNRTAEATLGLPREAMLGKTDDELFPKARAEMCAQEDRDTIALGGAPLVLEESVPDGAGGLRTFVTKKVASFGPEGPRHIVCVAEDISDQKAAAAALEAAVSRAEAANHAKSAFLANMSHEIRTPLNGVVGVAEALARTELTGGQREMVDLIRESGQSLARLLSDILDLARIESGKLELEIEPFDLAGCARSVAALAEMRCQEKNVSLAVEIDPEAEVWVAGDGARLKQVLTNLVSNAVKFTDRGEVRLRLLQQDELGGFRFEVIDTGVGFDAVAREQIFARFQQADGSITRRFGGSGLGLAITRQLVELMGGTIHCDSTPGRGSCFTVCLSLPTVCPMPTADASSEEPAHLGALRVLLADDHPTNRKVVAMILAQCDVDLVEVEDGKAALNAFRAGRFDLVLMDMQMPVMDGLTATRLIREHERATGLAATPIVMLTANALQEHVRCSLEAGADRHMAKPITAAGLLSTLVELTAPDDVVEAKVA